MSSMGIFVRLFMFLGEECCQPRWENFKLCICTNIGLYVILDKYIIIQFFMTFSDIITVISPSSCPLPFCKLNPPLFFSFISSDHFHPALLECSLDSFFILVRFLCLLFIKSCEIVLFINLRIFTRK